MNIPISSRQSKQGSAAAQTDPRRQFAVQPKAVAPPVYRPQPAVQLKAVAPPVYLPKSAVQPKAVAPPVYRPQPPLQPKAVAPPVYRPQPTVQPKAVVAPVYRPQPAVQPIATAPLHKIGSVQASTRNPSLASGCASVKSAVIQPARGRGRGRGGGGAVVAVPVQGWRAGIQGPKNFNPTNALNLADFTQCTYVQAARAVGHLWDYTVYAYTFVEVDDYSVCVVAHAHITGDANVDGNWGPGNAYIPGWEHWGAATPAGVVTTLRNQYKAALVNAIAHNADLPGGHILAGQFPGDDRYPFPIMARAFDVLFA